MSEVPHYPTGVFPGILGEMQHKYGNTPKDAALSGPCLIAAGMIAASGVARCRRDESDGDMTINIAQIVIAPSGAGKSVHTEFNPGSKSRMLPLRNRRSIRKLMGLSFKASSLP